MLATILALTERRQGEPLPHEDQIGVGTDEVAVEGVHLIGVLVYPLWGRLRTNPLLTHRPQGIARLDNHRALRKVAIFVLHSRFLGALGFIGAIGILRGRGLGQWLPIRGHVRDRGICDPSQVAPIGVYRVDPDASFLVLVASEYYLGTVR